MITKLSEDGTLVVNTPWMEIESFIHLLPQCFTLFFLFSMLSSRYDHDSTISQFFPPPHRQRHTPPRLAAPMVVAAYGVFYILFKFSMLSFTCDLTFIIFLFFLFQMFSIGQSLKEQRIWCNAWKH